MRKRAYPPPFRVGDRVRYTGTTTAWFGITGTSEVDTDRPPDLYPGVVGSVVENHAGIDARPEVFGPGDEPCDGWSMIELPSGGRRAATRGPDLDWAQTAQEAER